MSHVATDRLVDFFEHLQASDVPRLAQLYAPDARFKDPFNEVQGIRAIETIFQHMFKTLDEPQFIVQERLAQGRQCFLTWQFRFRFKRMAPVQWQTIQGATHCIFNDLDQVIVHRDYWDAAEELYEKLPLLRHLMRWLRQQAMR